VPLLAALSESDREVLARHVTRKRYRRNDVIFQREDPGNSLFIIEKGAVRVFVPGAQGTDLTLAVFNAGDFFGDMSLLDGRPRSASIAATLETTTLVLERADFISLLRARPDAAMAVLEVVAKRLRDAGEMASDLAFLGVGGRLAKRLLDLAETNGVQGADGSYLDMPITQEELATMIGVTRESVNRNLNQFRRLGWVQYKGRKFLIRNPDGLRERCE
jgi:CRP-like cAMP-binding protein